MGRPDPYAILGVTPGAGPQEVRRAWRALVSRYHPDRYAGASADVRAEAQAHAAVVNAAYEEIRSGRARRRGSASRPSATRTSERSGERSGAGSGAGATGFGFGVGDPIGDRDRADETAGGGGAPGDGEPWIDPDLFAQGVRLIEERRRVARSRSRWRLLAVVVAVAVGALLLHLSFSREYGYDRVWDGQGNAYSDVECGDGYDRGRTTAAALREQAATVPNGAELRHKADVIEEVCGEWADLLPAIAVVSLPSLGFAVWWLFLRRRPVRPW